jgi:hypothetical protein
MPRMIDNLYELMEVLTEEVNDFCNEHHVSPTLPWIMMRQQADFELHKLDAEE